LAHGFSGGRVRPEATARRARSRPRGRLFDESLPGFLAEHDEPVAFLHLDADLYSSTRTVLDLVGPRLVAGSVVLFDEYFNYPGWQAGEHRAWQEYVNHAGLTFRYEGYTYNHEQLIVTVAGHSGSTA